VFGLGGEQRRAGRRRAAGDFLAVGALARCPRLGGGARHRLGLHAVCLPGVPIGFGRARAEEAEEEAARACGGPFKHMDMALAAVRSAQSLRDCWRLAVVSFWSQPAKGYTRT
jgi:hypothetical protein